MEYHESVFPEVKNVDFGAFDATDYAAAASDHADDTLAIAKVRRSMKGRKKH